MPTLGATLLFFFLFLLIPLQPPHTLSPLFLLFSHRPLSSSFSLFFFCFSRHLLSSFAAAHRPHFLSFLSFNLHPPFTLYYASLSHPTSAVLPLINLLTHLILLRWISFKCSPWISTIEYVVGFLLLIGLYMGWIPGSWLIIWLASEIQILSRESDRWISSSLGQARRIKFSSKSEFKRMSIGAENNASSKELRHQKSL